MSKNYVTLPSRGILAIDGPDRAAFLQGLVSNDVTQAGPSRAIYAAFLTPQGKYLHDFLIVELGGKLLLDGEAERLADLQRRLKMYKLRSKITLEDVSAQYSVTAAFGQVAAEALGLADEPGAAERLAVASCSSIPGCPHWAPAPSCRAGARRKCWSLRASRWWMSGLMNGFGWKLACRMAAATCWSIRLSCWKTTWMSFTPSPGRRAATWGRN